ncbi:sulfatase [Granulosicoccus antarcticus]|uniref:Arylsulfatase n=1 Tax=Granulosicoccus antarcticus IMCC3135 TaxID=1192854 RepID=A0A2Z2P2V8_9GAMM|nr:sulfatase-like hydrolase/transferase [Granulosicoccus antarcticus]ASJ74064.1 Arylsulfatase [Granulosicoccus antarcticus IMCC3135]
MPDDGIPSQVKRPNVILITTDQQRGDCVGYQPRGVKTPHIDRIAQAGTRFDTCITPHPMCQAARASILTGKLPYTHGVRDNGRNLANHFGADGLGGIFSQAGYQTQFIGKAHLSTHETFNATGQPECYYSTADYPADWGGPYFGFESVELLLRPHHHCAWNDPPYTLHYENYLNTDNAGRQRWEKAKVHANPQGLPDTTHLQVWRSALEDEWHSTPWIADRTVDMIQDMGDEPLFAWVSFPDPHPPFLAAEPWASMYHPDEVDIPEHRELDLDNRPWWHRAFLESPIRKNVKRPHAEAGKDWGESKALTETELRDITALYYGMITAIDHQVGRILDALEERGELENTIIIFTSDHGEWLGDHGLLLKGPMLYDGLLRVPYVMSGPNIPAGKIVHDPVSTLDIRATLADMCGLQVSADNGESLVGLLQNTASRDFALNEWEVDETRSGIGMDLSTVRSQRYRMSVDLRTDTGELYDLQEDPHEMHNLFGDPGYAKTQAEHLSMINSRPDDQIPVAPRVGWH